jgi:hypothetical protein
VLSHIAFGHLDPIASCVVSTAPDLWDFLLDELKRLFTFALIESLLDSSSPGEVGCSPASDSTPDMSGLDDGVPEPGLDIGGARDPVDLRGWRRVGLGVSNYKSFLNSTF